VSVLDPLPFCSSPGDSRKHNVFIMERQPGRHFRLSSIFYADNKINGL
jgi:hypothetical protein